LYNHIVIGDTNLHTSEYGGIYRVLDGNAVKAVQFRLLVPLIFKAFTYLHIPDIPILMFMIIVFTYFTILFFYLILNIYFQNRTANYFAALFLFYPMVWNFMILNWIFLFMDNSLLFFLTAGLYFILSRKNNWLLAISAIGTLNHPSILMLIPAFLLFNYNRLLKKETIMYAILMAASYFICFFILGKIYPYFPPVRDVSLVDTSLGGTIDALKELPLHMLIRNIVLNLGGLHIFAALFVISGAWKKIKLQYILIYLLIVPYLIVVVFRAGIRIEEMRNWIPLVPFVVIPALLYISQIKDSFFRISDELIKESVS